MTRALGALCRLVGSCRKVPTLLHSVALVSSLAAVPALADGASFGPFGSISSPVTRDAIFHANQAPSADLDEMFLRLSYDFYVRVLTPIDGPTCAHRPTCARYGLLAIRRHGLLGMWLAFDRVFRGAHSSAVRQLTLAGDGEHTWYLDPLEESTFWFSRSP